jgi:hypothetical protein
MHGLSTITQLKLKQLIPLFIKETPLQMGILDRCLASFEILPDKIEREPPQCQIVTFLHIFYDGYIVKGVFNDSRECF